MKLYTELVADHHETNYRQFNLSCNSVSDLFDRCLNLQMKGLSKIRIEFTSRPNVLLIAEPVKMFPFVLMDKTFDFAHYNSLSNYDRRKMVIETLYESLKLICEKLDYDLAPFTAAYEKVKELNYENRFIWNKLTLSPNKKYKSGIQIEVNEEVADISTVYYDSKTMQLYKQVNILNTIPHYMYIYGLINKGLWVDSETYTVTNKSQEVQFITSLKKDTVDIKLIPQTHTLEELQEALKRVQPH